MSVIHINPENMESEVTKSDIPVIVDCWAPWCQPCQLMGPIFEELSGEYDGKLKFAKLNTEDHQELASGFGIRGIPTLILMKDGKEVDRIVGFGPKEVIKQKIDDILSK